MEPDKMRDNSENVILAQQYQVKILQKNTVRNLLPLDIRILDGELHFYYNITSKQSLKSLFAKRTMEKSKIEDFFTALISIYMDMEEFLLEVEDLLLVPECIFQDIDTEDFFFVYYPAYEDKQLNQIRELASCFIEHADCADEEFLKQLYRLYEQLNGSENPCIQDLIYLWQGSGNREKHWSDNKNNMSSVQEDTDNEENGKLMQDKEEAAGMDWGEEDRVNACILNDEESTNANGWKENRIKKKFKNLDIHAVTEKVGLLERWKRKAEEREREREIYRQSIKQEIEGYCSEDIAYGETEKKCDFIEETVMSEEEYGNTIYIEGNDVQEEHKLYEEGGRSTRIIPLHKLPLVIGRKQELVDVVLQNSSISRMHVRFFKEKGIIFMEDLNSTNGTFKNGLRLEPYEKIEMVREDEIRLGKIEFTYR